MTAVDVLAVAVAIVGVVGFLNSLTLRVHARRLAQLETQQRAQQGDGR